MNVVGVSRKRRLVIHLGGRGKTDSQDKLNYIRVAKNIGAARGSRETMSRGPPTTSSYDVSGLPFAPDACYYETLVCCHPVVASIESSG